MQALTKLELQFSKHNEEIQRRFGGFEDRLNALESHISSVETKVEDSKFRTGADFSRRDFLQLLASGSAPTMRVAGTNLSKVNFQNLDLRSGLKVEGRGSRVEGRGSRVKG